MHSCDRKSKTFIGIKAINNTKGVKGGTPPHFFCVTSLNLSKDHLACWLWTAVQITHPPAYARRQQV